MGLSETTIQVDDYLNSEDYATRNNWLTSYAHCILIEQPIEPFVSNNNHGNSSLNRWNYINTDYIHYIYEYIYHPNIFAHTHKKNVWRLFMWYHISLCMNMHRSPIFFLGTHYYALLWSIAVWGSLEMKDLKIIQKSLEVLKPMILGFLHCRKPICAILKTLYTLSVVLVHWVPEPWVWVYNQTNLTMAHVIFLVIYIYMYIDIYCIMSHTTIISPILQQYHRAMPTSPSSGPSRKSFAKPWVAALTLRVLCSRLWKVYGWVKTRPGERLHFAMENGPVEIVDFLINSMVMFHGKM